MQLSATATSTSVSSMPLSATVAHTLVPAVPSFRTTLALCCVPVTRLNSAVTAALSLSTHSTPMHLFRPSSRAPLPLVLHQQTQAQAQLPVFLPAVFALPPTDRPSQTRTTSPILCHVLRTPTLAHTPAPKQAPLTSTAWLPATMPLRLDVLLSPMSEEH